MTTHLRARTLQAGAFLALVVGLVAGVQTAALAEPPTVAINSLSASEVTSGSTVTIEYTVSNRRGEGEQGDSRVSIQVSGMDCVDNTCSPSQNIDDSDDFSSKLRAPNLNPGEQRDVTITVNARNSNGETGTATETVKVKGPDAPQTVRQVSGRIKGSDGNRLSGVDVAMTDSAGHQYSTSTNGDGGYSFTSSDSQPIAPGNITVGAVKDGFQAKTVNVQGNAGRTVNVQITLKKLASESPSPSPSASVSASVEPTE